MFGTSLQTAVVLATVVLLVYVTVYDFRHMLVRNTSSMAVAGLYVVWSALGGFATLPGDLIAMAVLTFVALIMWFMKAMGAGDVKLYFGLGLFVGYEHLAIYTILLLVVSILFMILIKLARFSARDAGVVGRLKEFQSSGRAPYAVPMCLAAIPTLILRAFA